MKLSTLDNKTNQEIMEETFQEIMEEMFQEIIEEIMEEMYQETMDYPDLQDTSESIVQNNLLVCRYHKYKSLMLQDKKLLKENKLQPHHYINLLQHHKWLLMEMLDLDHIHSNS